MSSPQGYNVTQTPNFSPEMMHMFNAMIGGMGGEAGIGNIMKLLTGMAGGEGAAFAPMEAKAQQELQKMLGSTATQFSQLGARDSSAFQGAAAGAASDMASKLAQQRSQMQMDAISKLMGFSGQLLRAKPFETQLQEEGGFDWAKAGELGVKALPYLLKVIQAIASKNPAALATSGAEIGAPM